jgi:hypothetical protein
MKAAICGIKGLFVNMSHVTCIVNALHNTSEAVRNRCKILNNLIVSMKEVLSKSASRKALFKEFCELELPPNPVVTRWETWIETTSYYFANYEIVKKFIKTKLKATSKAVQTLIDLADNQKLEDEIFYVSDFAFLPEIIKGLGKQGLTLKNRN